MLKGVHHCRFDYIPGFYSEIADSTQVRRYRGNAHGLLDMRVEGPAVTTSTYRADGHILSQTDALGATTRFERDARGRLIKHTDPLGRVTMIRRDEAGLVVAVTDAAGGETKLERDGRGNVLIIRDPLGGLSSQRCDERGLVTEQSSPIEAKTAFAYDRQGNLVRATLPGGGVWRFTYDALGRRVSRTDPLGAETRELADGAVEAYRYDALGGLIEAKGPAGELCFERDALGRVVRELQRVDGEEHWTAITYDADGERVGRSTSLGHTESVTRGLLGERAQTVLDGAHRVEHRADLLGRETGRALPGGGWLDSSYDALGRVLRRRVGTSAAEPVALDTAYRYDEAGELVEAWDKARGRTRYAYDPIGQLLAMVPEKARAELFRYDAAGNLLEAEEGAEARVYGKGNRLLRKGDTEYRWDGDGRLSEKRRGEEVWRYRWDAAGLLKTVERGDGVKVGFTYDPFARRVSKKVTGADRALVSETRFVWDGDVLVHGIERRAAEAGDPVVEERTYLFEDGGFAPVAHRERGEWFHYVNDPIGTPERLIDEAGKVACELSRTAWGATEEVGRAGTKIRFQGQYEDEETGLAYNRFRYYDATIGRFTNADPIGLNGGTNLFAYARNPLLWSDPLGLAPPTSKQLDRATRLATDVRDAARTGSVQNAPGAHYGNHGFTGAQVQGILANPDGVYLSHGRECKMMFHKDGDVVVTTGPGSGQGRVITAYGASGIKGPSGAAALGGSPSDPGAAITSAMITGGTTPVAPGKPPIAPGTKVL